MGSTWPREGLGCEQLMATSEGLDAPKFTSKGISRRLPTQPNPAQSIHFKEEQITGPPGMKAENIKALQGLVRWDPTQPTRDLTPLCPQGVLWLECAALRVLTCTVTIQLI